MPPTDSYESLDTEALALAQEIERIEHLPHLHQRTLASLAIASAMRDWQKRFCAFVSASYGIPA